MPIVTISRGAKSGGAALAAALAERLGCRCLSREILTESARKYNIEEELLHAQMSRPPGFCKIGTRSMAMVFKLCAIASA